MAKNAQLSVRFLGLSGLIPPRGKGEPWLSVLPNLRGGWPAGTRGLPYDIPPHQALFIVRQRDLVDSEVPIKLRVSLTSPTLGGFLPAGEELVLFEPKQEEMSVESEASILTVVDEIPGRYGEEAARAGEERSLCWIPPLRRVSTRARFDWSLLTEDESRRVAVPVDSRLAATFVLDAGELGATGVIRTLAGSPELYEFGPPDQANAMSGWKQSLATGYELRLSQPDGTIVVALEDRSGTKRRIELGGERIQTWVVNRELEEILGFSAVHELVGGATGDRDFACFYAMTEGWDGDDLSALSIPFAATAGGGGWSKPCGAARFDA